MSKKYRISKPDQIPQWAQDATSELPGLLTAQEAADFLSISVKTLKRWTSQGKIRSVRLTPAGSGGHRYARSEVARMLVRAAGEGV